MADAGETESVDAVRMAAKLKYAELSAATEQAELKAETRYKLLASASKYVTLATQNAYVRLASRLSYINIKAIAQLGDWLVFRVFTDATQALDQVLRLFGKIYLC